MRTIALSILTAAAALLARAQGVERWSVKTSVPDGTNFSKAAKAPLADLLALKDVDGVTHNDKRYKTERIPAKADDKYPEGKLVSTTGWLHLVASETDGDYHIQISDPQTSGDNCLVIEVPNEGEKFTKSAELQPMFQAVRDLIKTKMLAGKQPSVSGSVM